MNFISLGSLSFGGICVCVVVFCFPSVTHSAQCSSLLNLSCIRCLLGLFTQVVLWKRKNWVVYYIIYIFTFVFFSCCLFELFYVSNSLHSSGEAVKEN